MFLGFSRMSVAGQHAELTITSITVMVILAIHITAGEDMNMTTPVMRASCEERCVESYFPGRPCYCNDACDQYENCCYDFYEVCKPNMVWKDEWQQHGGHVYKYFSDQSGSVLDSRDQCRQHGSLLLSINNVFEEDFVTADVLRKRTLSSYMGGYKTDTGTWQWEDGTSMPLPSDTWHNWFYGQPSEGNCSVITNYEYWEMTKFRLDSFIWRSFSCDVNVGKAIQGYICEGTLECTPNPCLNNGTCQYIGENIGDREYTCTCPENYVGDFCEYEVVEGETWTRCGETHLTSPDGVITSPLYPKDYPANTRCSWLIDVGADKTVHLTLEEMSLEMGKDCYFDELLVYDGDNTDASLITEPLCGDANVSVSWRSSSSKVLIVFNTDHILQKSGFEITYRQDVCGLGTGESGCGTRRLFASQCGQVEIRQHTEETPCEWQIKASPGEQINITFHHFEIHDSGRDCTDGGLSVYNDEEDHRELIGTFCGQRFPWQLQTAAFNLLLQLTVSEWDPHHFIDFSYNVIESSKQNYISQPKKVSGRHGSLTSIGASPQILTSQQIIKEWVLRVPPGEKLELQWTLYSEDHATLSIFDGHSDDAVFLAQVTHNVEDTWHTQTGTIDASMFSVFLRFQTTPDDDTSHINITYQTQEWLPELSGCYRPHYFNQQRSRGTENQKVSLLEPAVAMISDPNIISTDLGYQPGIYCKFVMETAEDLTMSLSFLDGVIPPLSENCDYDGLVIYDGNTTDHTMHGPFCGRAELVDGIVHSSGHQLLVVFYSSAVGDRRLGGAVRAVATVRDLDECRLDTLSERTADLIESQCGVLLSPGFPGLVSPGLWLWTIKAPKLTSMTMYVYYVRGPAIKNTNPCQHYFKVLEISRDSGKLRQNEGHILKLCSDVDLFLPKTAFKLPPHQKMAIELYAGSTSQQLRWQFKVAYKSEPFPDYPHTQAPVGACPEGYSYYRHSCYRYYPWVLRHYETEYSWQQTWQGSLEQCEKENATLLSLRDEQETGFIKWIFSVLPTEGGWFWDPASTYQQNHRVVFIGLHNKYGVYRWTDDSVLSYSDWYVPGSDWEQPPLHEDSVGLGFLPLSSSQPTQDQGSLCTAMMVTSPYESLHWSKVPCDYPIFRGGAICERAAELQTQDNERKEIESKRTSTYDNLNNVKVCPEEWMKMEDGCYRLVTRVLTSEDRNSMSYVDSESTCSNLGGTVAEATPGVITHLTKWLGLWRIGEETGRIFLLQKSNNTICQYIEVNVVIKLLTDDVQSQAVVTAYLIWKQHLLDRDVQYDLREGTCDTITAKAVFCQATATVVSETCGPQEFQCDSGVCVTVDARCDGRQDCRDMSDERDCGCGVEMFQCDSGACIPQSLYCDFILHCDDGSDEMRCYHEECSEESFRCNNGECVNLNATCDFTPDCKDASDEESDTCEGECQGFLCYSGKCLHPRLQTDLISDCPGQAAEDETTTKKESYTFFQLLKDDLSFSNSSLQDSCDFKGDAPCRQGYRSCYARTDACVYDTVLVYGETGGESVQAGCRDGSHLRENCEYWECPEMFHCPGSFCLPHRKVCDDVMDCPGGEDENQCEGYTCPVGMFKCQGENYCVPHHEVCDGVKHCRMYGDDEKYCEPADILCEQSFCDCQGYTATCTNVIGVLPTQPGRQTRHLRGLHITNSSLQLHTHSLSRLHWLGILRVTHSGLKTLPEDSFKDLSNLYHLDLSYNQLERLHPDSLRGLKSLRVLLLNNNRLVSMDQRVLLPVPRLVHLDVTDNQLGSVKEDTFEKSRALEKLHTDDYKFCCIAPHVEECTPEADEFSSCEDLMANPALQMSIWVMGLMACLGNLFVVAWRLMRDRKRVSSFLIINLGCSDFLMGVYMLIIASVDQYYRGRYIVHAESWRSSSLCQLAGVLAMLSSELSVFMLTVITLDRVVAIIFPLKRVNLRIRHARLVVMAGWCVCLVFSVLPTTGIGYFGDAFFGRTGVCLPFQLSNQRPDGWEYSVFIFLVLNFASFLVIFIGYLVIFMTVKTSVKDMGEKANNTTDEYALAKKLVIIVLTDFICWVPIIFLGFATLGGAHVSPQVSAWVAVFILPLNSSLNPVLYTISAIECGRKRRGGAGGRSSNTYSSAVSQGGNKMPTVYENKMKSMRSEGDLPQAMAATNGSTDQLQDGAV